MKVLLIADSHGYDMEWLLTGLGENIEVYTVVLGRGTSAIRGLYRDRLEEIVYFDPSVVLIHCGHNDISRHILHNTNPLFITAAFHLVMELALEVQANFPTATLVISSLLPRKAGNFYTVTDSLKYNKIAKRFGQMVNCEAGLHNATSPEFRPSLNRNLWGRISRAEAKEALLDFGGLHLNSKGKVVLVNEWFSVMDM
jgi:lysophospholipase L1-like esterase